MGNKRVVHIVDDEETIRKALGFTLRTAGFVLEVYASGPEFLSALGDAEKGCVILDMHMPDMDGLQVQAELTRRGIGMPVVVLTGNGDPTLAVQAMRAGAVDFLAKPVEKAALLGAIDRAFSRLENIAGRAAEQADALSKAARLTQRERAILRGIARGHPNNLIADELGITSRTVELDRASLMIKLGAQSLPDLLRIAFAVDVGGSASADRR
ncbi:DNA-binding response regulator [Sphingomonas koreensis]|jgi:two-component system response regulator FixJ|uniref:DNA-binding response regulator n=2 Tax=Sphingomonas TaxID=13687 RepID=A0A1L6JHL9_9SPHN|nr:MULTISPECIES: response regulator [Sphingomonadaceae]AKH18785.1 response regulator FixJ [Sphingomonas sanxanigenens DSM 19645 = NX02]APR55422.1 DNA-binding response regulator [Sphingomonas koreensis]MBF5092358.1 response regulator transcription factor [Novosphingobium sp. NBM11]RSU17413.1 DNA-binding response regulator [Sphingomonas koreensis]RSU19600.1 DNA-binding response regulator [Sphingomonas koreensis]